MTNGWNAAQIRAAINRCEGDCEAMIARREPSEKIEGKRKGMKMLYKWLERAEREELNGQMAERDGGGRQPGRAV